MSLLDIDERLFDLLRAGRVRPLAAHRHQALRALRRRARRRRRLQRRERARAARVPQELQDPGRGRAPARSPAACRRMRNNVDLWDCLQRGLPVRARHREGRASPTTPSCRCRSTRCGRSTRWCRSTTSCPAARRPADAIWKLLTDLARRPRAAARDGADPVRLTNRTWQHDRRLETAAQPENLRRVVIDPVTPRRGPRQGDAAARRGQPHRSRRGCTSSSSAASRSSSRAGRTGRSRCWCSGCAASARSPTTSPRPRRWT